MIEQTAINRFMLPPIGKYGRLYQELLKGFGSYHQLGNRLIQLAEQARAFNQFDAIPELALILSNLPLKHYQSIGQYYLALTICRNGTGDLEQAASIFEKVASDGPLAYRAEAMLSLSSIACINQQPDETIRYCLEAAKVGNFNTTIKALRGIAIVKGLEGNHRSAANDLEKLYPMFKYAPPYVYFDYMNSLAVELGEAGRKEEARGIINHVIASPFAPAYPEWQETARELKPANRSCIRVPEIKHQQVEIEPTEDEEQASEPDQPAAIVSFPKLKEADPPKKPERVTPQELSEMTRSEKRELILAAVRSDAIRESEYNKLIFMFGLLDRGPGINILDLEDETVLDDVMVDWANLVPPEELAAVLSALRDCDNDRRRNDLIDRMIRKAFEQSRICGLTESEWRHKVESKLP